MASTDSARRKGKDGKRFLEEGWGGGGGNTWVAVCFGFAGILFVFADQVASVRRKSVGHGYR